ncbi:MAG: diacylglycerol kinase [Pseudomonadota bacterium]
MKGQSLFRRFGYAVAGLREAIAHESSIRIQTVAALGVIAILGLTRAPLIWWALCLLAAGLVIVAELFNSALEALADGVHPDLHPKIRIAKDMAAAAVLVAAITAAIIAALFLLR